VTTQSMPISRERRDYIQSGIVLIGITIVSVLGVYFTHPAKLRSNATTSLLGIDFPNFQGIIMRQPRATIVALLALSIFSTALIFIGRQALPFFSRSLAWGSVVLIGVILAAVGFFNSDGTDGGWFRFLLLSFCFVGGSTALAEAMIFYRRFFHDRPFRTKLAHKLAFAFVCALLAASMSGAYYHFAVKDGLFLDYGVAKVTSNPTIPDVPTSSVPTENSTTPFGSVPETSAPASSAP